MTTFAEGLSPEIMNKSVGEFLHEKYAQIKDYMNPKRALCLGGSILVLAGIGTQQKDGCSGQGPYGHQGTRSWGSQKGDRHHWNGSIELNRLPGTNILD